MRIFITSLLLFTILITSYGQDTRTIYYKKNGNETSKPDKSVFYSTIIKSEERFYVQRFITESNLLIQESEINSWDPLIENGLTTYFDKISGDLIAKGYYQNGELSDKWVIKIRSSYDTINYESVDVKYTFNQIAPKQETFYIVEKMPFFDYVDGWEQKRAVLDNRIKQLNAAEDSQIKEDKYIVLQKRVIELNNQAFDIYKARNLYYPVRAKEKGIQGIVYLQFVINEYGKIVETEILKGVNKDLDKEAVRLVNSMSNWTPGVQRDKPVRVAMTAGVKFGL